MAINVKINGEAVNFDGEVSIMDILSERKVRPEIVAVELNGELINRAKYDELKLQDGDQLEYLLYMAGGSILKSKDRSADPTWT